MSDTSRRKFLAVAGAGAAAAAGRVGITGGSATAAGETRRTPGSARETVVAYVKDHHSSELRLHGRGARGGRPRP